MIFRPFEVEVTRGTQVESRHTVHAAVIGRKNNRLEIYGDGDLLISPRSSLKPIQALPMILTGAAKKIYFKPYRACSGVRISLWLTISY